LSILPSASLRMSLITGVLLGLLVVSLR
jgi:hypothetical protein